IVFRQPVNRVAVLVDDDDVHLDEIDAGAEGWTRLLRLLRTDEATRSSQGCRHEPRLCVEHRGSLTADQVGRLKLEVRRFRGSGGHSELRTSYFELQT